MSTWYRINKYQTKVYSVPVDRETTAYLLLPPSQPGSGLLRLKKQTALDTYYPTWASAHAALVARARKELDDAEMKVVFLKGELRKAEALKPDRPQ